MIVSLRDDLIGVRHPLVWSYLLIEGDDVVAIDSGLGASARAVKRWFKATGRSPKQLRAILLTHGHWDHVGGAAALQRWSGAPVHLHPHDRDVASGQFRYQGAARLVGLVERFGRLAALGRTPTIDHSLADGQELDFWGGLRVIHLPGHTPGHVGFYAPSKRLLFPGDAVLARGTKVFFPFRLINVDDAAVKRSILRVAPLEVDWVYPMHHRKLNHNLMTNIRRYAMVCALAEAAAEAASGKKSVERPTPRQA